MPEANQKSRLIWLCRIVFAALIVAFAALILSMFFLDNEIFPIDNKKLTLSLGWLTVSLLIPGLVAARFVDKYGTPQVIRAVTGDIPFELKKDPTGAVITGICALLMCIPLFLKMIERAELAQPEAWALLSLCPVVLGGLWWFAASKSLIMRADSLQSRVLLRRTEILYKDILRVSAKEGAPQTLVLKVSGAAKENVELNLIVFKRASLMRMLQILEREAPQTQWDEIPAHWRNGEF